MSRKCFVIMPFGKKELGDGSGRVVDFDKVYRVIIQRAVRDAGLEPLRDDEHPGPGVIHAQLFRELRDQSLVLADVSLNNPNVFYELGIRHTLAPSGTVLLRRAGLAVPFDIGLLRVVDYECNGTDLDWDEVERVVPKLVEALRQASQGTPDSPVHALLADVAPKSATTGPVATANAQSRDENALLTYQTMVADAWRKEGKPLASLLEEHGKSAFGAGALDVFCRAAKRLPPETPRVARLLYAHRRFAEARALFAHVVSATAPVAAEAGNEGPTLSADDIGYYASAISEALPTAEGADQALAVLREAQDRCERTKALVRVRFLFADRVGALRFWRWRLTKSPEDLRLAVEAMLSARQLADDWLAEKGHVLVGFIAKLHLRLLLTLRRLRELPPGVTPQDLRRALLALDETRAESVREASYLRWYKAIALADAGDKAGTLDAAAHALTADARQLPTAPAAEEQADLEQLQPAVLRRFIDDSLDLLHHTEIVGLLSRVLQSASRRGPAPAAG